MEHAIPSRSRQNPRRCLGEPWNEVAGQSISGHFEPLRASRGDRSLRFRAEETASIASPRASIAHVSCRASAHDKQKKRTEFRCGKCSRDPANEAGLPIPVDDATRTLRAKQDVTAFSKLGIQEPSRTSWLAGAQSGHAPCRGQAHFPSAAARLRIEGPFN